VHSALQGGSGGGAVGLVSNLRSYLWIPISQNSYRHALPAPCIHHVAANHDPLTARICKHCRQLPDCSPPWPRMLLRLRSVRACLRTPLSSTNSPLSDR
jgi:hypothetical protein